MTDRTIHIRACVFGGRFVVTVEPRTIDLPSSEFRTHADAERHANALAAHHGWPVVDKTGEHHG
jgi:hypothetical protein